ncbi:NAD-dependent epimerase/dehydratase family protein [Candidatus Peregrinibacteria bacterium]|nr:NAD-dependent epimerase/dehydratase family protein [Candidatus Peregrinibacteria bacterium]
MKNALITGVTGQDGAYLAKFLLDKSYKVFGLVRRLSTPNFWRLEELGIKDKVEFLDGDMTDQESLNNAVKLSKPVEVYNLAAQSYVGTSWKQAVLTAEVDAVGVIKILNAVKDFASDAKFYQASSSEMFGNSAKGEVKSEDTPLHPTSPYAISKLFAHWMAVNYKDSYGMFVSCGILFNHESPLRGIEFVTRKISDGVARIKLGLADKLYLGNLESKRDWGFAGDYVEAMWMMLQQEDPENFVIATGETHSVADFCREAFEVAGIENWKDYVAKNEKFMRPSELHALKGDSSKAGKELGWEPKVNFGELVRMMVEADLERLSK